MSPNAESILASAMELPAEERAALIDALNLSLLRSGVDEGQAEEVQSAWGDEIARRLEEIESGRVKLVPADEAERMIRGDERPQV
ncbi:MAG: addiction module protein [Planctomycetota bacterium]